jgi:hypothetical protein
VRLRKTQSVADRTFMVGRLPALPLTDTMAPRPPAARLPPSSGTRPGAFQLLTIGLTIGSDGRELLGGTSGVSVSRCIGERSSHLGVTPQACIYTAIVGGFVLGPSSGAHAFNRRTDGRVRGDRRGIVAAHGLSGLLMVTTMAGVILPVDFLHHFLCRRSTRSPAPDGPQWR